MRQDSEKAEPQTGKKMYAKRKRPAGASAGPASNRANPNNLVELIVVLVILAILAAILVPALLGWIDEAKKKQYVLDARNVYMATQAVVDEQYAKDPDSIVSFYGPSNSADLYDRIVKLADVECGTISITVEATKAEGSAKISNMVINDLVETGLKAELKDDGWEITLP